MRKREKISALILSRRNIGEADRLLTFFTKEYGLLRVMAKGVRKIPSRRGGHLEPFTKVEVVISVSHDRYFLSSVEAVDVYPALQADGDALLHARNLSLIISGLFEENEQQITIYESLLHAWQILPELDAAKKACLEVTLAIHIMQLAGVMPDLTSCRLCKVTKPTDAVVFDSKEGAWHCMSCQGSSNDNKLSLPPHLLKVLRFFNTYPKKALYLRLEQNDSRQILDYFRTYVADVTRQPALTSQW